MGKHDKDDACSTCGGKGEITVTSDGQDGRGTQVVSCSACNGSGKA